MNANAAKTVLALANESVKFLLLLWSCYNRLSKNLPVCTVDPVLIQRVGPDRHPFKPGAKESIFSVYVPLVGKRKKKKEKKCTRRAECHNLLFSVIPG